MYASDHIFPCLSYSVELSTADLRIMLVPEVNMVLAFIIIIVPEIKQIFTLLEVFAILGVLAAALFDLIIDLLVRRVQ
jgi:hypothetical protein